MTKDELERSEEVYYENYVNQILEVYGQDRLNTFELNLEVSFATAMNILHFKLLRGIKDDHVTCLRLRLGLATTVACCRAF